MQTLAEKISSYILDDAAKQRETAQSKRNITFVHDVDWFMNGHHRQVGYEQAKILVCSPYALALDVTSISPEIVQKTVDSLREEGFTADLYASPAVLSIVNRPLMHGLEAVGGTVCTTYIHRANPAAAHAPSVKCEQHSDDE
jgi:hypothetical protein